MLRAKTGRSSNKNVAQSIVLELMLRAWTKRYEMNTDVTSKDEAKPQQEYSPEQRSG
ncbi:hypothetical protein ABVC70_08465 [Hoylesella timonensis]|uniref:hypothetical protein n=1 Tax=Hoylesella timonensis TaxID=386414 RepID=UPI00336A1DC6